MEMHGMGELLLKVREERGVSQRELSSGLCTPRELSKIEMGERLPNTFLLDVLMSRLGKSADRFEYVVSEETYALYELRVKLEAAVEKRDFKLSEDYIKTYEKNLNEKDNLHFQYLDMMRALLLWEKEEKTEECVLYLEQAMDRTMHSWREEKCFAYIMSWMEAGLLVLWAEKKKEQDDLIGFLEKMLVYADKQWGDKEEKAKIYPYTARVLCEALIKQKRYEEIKEISRKGIELLVKTNSLANLLELLGLEIEALEALSEDAAVRKKKQKESLEDICKKYDDREKRIGIFPRIKKELYLDWEIIRKQRIALGITQEELSEDICSQESLARIEQGRRPHNKNYRKLTKKLFWEKDKRSNDVSAWDYEVLKFKDEISKLEMEYRYQEAKEKLMNFQFQETAESRQYYIYTKAALDFQLGKIEEKKTLEILKKALFMTLSPKADENLSKFVLTRQEVNILNNIAVVYAQIGQSEVAVKLYQEVLKGYENSKVREEFKSGKKILILGNMAGYLEGIDKFEEALESFKKAMELSIKVRDIGTITEMLGNAAYTLERMEEKENSIELFSQAYYISDLISREKTKKMIENHFK